MPINSLMMLTAKILAIAINVLFSSTGKNSIIEFLSNINGLCFQNVMIAILAYEAIKNYRPDYRVILKSAFMKSAEELLTVNRTCQFLYNPKIALKKP